MGSNHALIWSPTWPLSTMLLDPSLVLVVIGLFLTLILVTISGFINVTYLFLFPRSLLASVMGILLKIWTSFAKKFWRAYFVLRMTILVLYRVVLRLLFLLVYDRAIFVWWFQCCSVSFFVFCFSSYDRAIFVWKFWCCSGYFFVSLSSYNHSIFKQLFQLSLLVNINRLIFDYFGWTFKST